MRHRKAVTPQFLCRIMQCGNSTLLLCRMNTPLQIYLDNNKIQVKLTPLSNDHWSSCSSSCHIASVYPHSTLKCTLNQCCQNFRAQNRGKFAFLPAESDFKEAKFLLSNYTPNFLNLGAFQQLQNQNHTIGWKKQSGCSLPGEVDNRYQMLSRKS